MIKNKLIGFLFVSIIVSFSGSLVSSSQETIKWVSLNNLPCQARSKLVDINSFFPFTVSVNKCGGCCNTIDYPYARLCVPNKVKNMNAKMFFCETKFLVHHELCQYKYGFNESVCNPK